MYDMEEPVEVSLLCENSLMKHLIDHFGLDVETETVDDNHFRARVLVCTSPTFYRWVFGWCGRMKIESPAFVLDEYQRDGEGCAGMSLFQILTETVTV